MKPRKRHAARDSAQIDARLLATRPDLLSGVRDESVERGERVIATSRVVLAVAAFGVILLDPRQPTSIGSALYPVLGAYIVYSSVLLWLYSRGRLDPVTTSKPILVADIVWFTIIVHLSEGGTSAFILFYLFAVCSAAIRWGIRTTMKVAVFSATLYLVSIILVRWITLGPDFTMHSAHLMRPVYLILLAYLVGFIGEHELLAKLRLIEIISMQREAGRARSSTVMLARLLRHVTRFFEADYVLLQLMDSDGKTIEWEGTRTEMGRMVLRNVPAAPWSVSASSRTAYRVSHAFGNWGRRAEVYEHAERRPRTLFGDEEPGFLAHSRMRSLFSIPLAAGSGVRGRLLVGRTHANLSKGDLDFCQTLASQAAMVLDNVVLQAKAEELAVAEERARIARDVHDGFVQSLASIDVGIEVCRRLAERAPDRLERELEDVQRTVKQGYREARVYLERLRRQVPGGPDVGEAVRAVVREFRDRGDVQVDLEADVCDIPARTGVGFELLQIVREGLTNVHRHAAARRASVSVNAEDEEFLLVIKDDGRGFPTAANNSNDELPRSAAPWSIRERVDALGGTLTLRSRTGRGSELRITLPRATGT
jgi:signal transduction histidine kinase